MSAPPASARRDPRPSAADRNRRHPRHPRLAPASSTAEQAERVAAPRTKVNSLGVEQAVIQLGFANEVQIAQALAAHAGPVLREAQPPRPGPRRRHEGASSGPFARKHGMVAIAKTAEDDHGRGPRSLRAVPRRRHQARHRAGRGARGGHPHRRGDDQQGLLRPQGQPADGREAAQREPHLHRGPRRTRSSCRRRQRAGPGRRARREGPRPHPRATPSSSAPPTSTSSPSGT